MTFLQNSVLKTSRHFVFCNNFPKFSVLEFFRHNPGLLCQIPHQLFLQKISKNSSFQPKIKEETKSQSSINCEKVPIEKRYKNGFWRTKNQIYVFIKAFP